VPRSMQRHQERNATSTPESEAGVLVVRRHHIGLFNSQKGRCKSLASERHVAAPLRGSVNAAQAAKTFESFGSTR
jgi:hypothetical protein